MPKRTQGSRRLDHVDRQSQVGVSGAMRARDVSRPDNADAAIEAEDDDLSDDQPARRERGGSAE